MKYLYITHIWNEIDYLPLKVKWCRENGLGIYILDNYSDDGSWEWMKQNKIACERIDTGGTFHLGILQKATDIAIRKIRPEWVIYLGMDSFAMIDNKLCDEITQASRKGFNIIQMTWANMLNTGEPRNKFDPFNTYFSYAPISQKIRLIWKFHPQGRLFADEIIYPKSQKILNLKGIILNYGNVKPTNQRLETLNRRKLAWKRGLTSGWGTHYLTWVKINWTWDATKVPDIRKSGYYRYIQKLQKL